ncbi:MAG: threonine aldolase family protein [Pseudomonadota bacterium]
MTDLRHDFVSDTSTRPTRAMRAAALDAPVGDEQRGEDPTTLALEARVADLLGKAAAVYLPSGSLCNEIAIGVHCRPGDEIICARQAHVIEAEGGAPAAIWGAMMHPLDDARGILAADSIAAAIRRPGRYAPRSRLLCVEQTVNLEGGAVWPVAALDAAAQTAHAAGLATHMDGARLMNAAVASGMPAARHAQGYDSVWLDFSKGLGAPVGAVLAGSTEFIAEAWQLKQRLGGAMRQSGMLAAMCLHALDHHVERLEEDHALAADLGRRIAQMPQIEQVLPVDSNIVIADLTPEAPDAAALIARLAEDGLRVSSFSPRRFRVVTHHDVGAASGAALIDALSRALDP